jgi:hypothetical protein
VRHVVCDHQQASERDEQMALNEAQRATSSKQLTALQTRIDAVCVLCVLWGGGVWWGECCVE